MGDMWRSQKMQLVQMIVQNDAAHAVVNKLGQVGIVEFRDLNAGTSFYKRSFVEEVRRCDELSRILRTIGEEYEESPIVVEDKDEALSLKLSMDDVEPKIIAVEDELSGLKATQDVSASRLSCPSPTLTPSPPPLAPRPPLGSPAPLPASLAFSTPPRFSRLPLSAHPSVPPRVALLFRRSSSRRTTTPSRSSASSSTSARRSMPRRTPPARRRSPTTAPSPRS